MKKTPPAIAVLLLICTLQGTQLPQSASTVAGIVLDDASGQPLSGVVVTLRQTEGVILRQDPPPPVTATDAEGRFSLETTRTGGYRIVPTKEGFVFYRESSRGTLARVVGLPSVWVSLASSTHIKNLRLRMGKPAVIRGRVVDSEGKPATKGDAAPLRFTYENDGTRMLRPNPVGRLSNGGLDDRGVFRIYDLPPGLYYLGIGLFPGTNIMGDNKYLYYPGLSTDEAKANPIQVRPGEDVDVGTLVLPPQQKSVPFTVRVSVPDALATTVGIHLGGNLFTLALQSNAAERVLRILSGHYDLIAQDSSTRIPGYYALATFDVFDSDIVQELVLKPTLRMTGKILLESASGERTPAPAAVGCRLDRLSSLDCKNSRVLPGSHQIEFPGLPPDTYVLSIKTGNRDFLKEGLNVIEDTELEIVLRQSDAIISGTARTAMGETLINGSVVLVPDPPNRGIEFRYYSVTTDADGRFEIRGIAPGSYRLFAWTELDGAPYRNAEFMKEFDGLGTPVNVESTTRRTVDLLAF